MLAYKKRVEIKRWTTKQRCSGGNETQPPTTKHRKVTEKTSAARKHGKNINKAESYKNKNYRNEELKNQSATIKHCSEFCKCTAIGTYTIYITNCGSIVCAKWPNGPIKMQNATLRCNKKWLYFYRYQSGYCTACFYYGIFLGDVVNADWRWAVATVRNILWWTMQPCVADWRLQTQWRDCEVYQEFQLVKSPKAVFTFCSWTVKLNGRNSNTLTRVAVWIPLIDVTKLLSISYGFSERQMIFR